MDLSRLISQIDEVKKVGEDSSLEEIEKAIAEAQYVREQANNLQLGTKIFINGSYGAMAAPYFLGYNVKVAEAITLQGQDVIHFASQSMEDYFKKLWPLDKKVHRVLGITKPGNVDTSVTVYGDTDSTYITFQEPYYNSEFEGERPYGVDFVLGLYNNRLADYLDKQFEKYAKPWNTTNLQNFELETILKRMISLAKKKYVGDKVYEDGIIHESLEKLKLTGIEVVRSDTPKFVRDKLIDVIKLFLEKGKDLDYREFVRYVKNIKKEFMAADVADISFNKSIGDYDKGVRIERDNSGKPQMVVYEHCPMHVRAAGSHNLALELKPELKKKYNLLRSGDKIKYYHVNDPSQDKPVFAFLPGVFPYEIAPEVNYDVQFAKAFVDPLNRFLAAMGFAEMPANLVVSNALF